MAQSYIHVYTCDRCGEVGKFSDLKDSYNWGKAAYKQVNGAIKNCTTFEGKVIWDRVPDVCPKCINELSKWWKEGKVK